MNRDRSVETTAAALTAQRSRRRKAALEEMDMMVYTWDVKVAQGLAGGYHTALVDADVSMALCDGRCVCPDNTHATHFACHICKVRRRYAGAGDLLTYPL